MKTLKLARIFQFVFAITLLLINNCNCGKENMLINPSNANELSQVLIMPNGTLNNSGNPPSPSNDNNAPEATSSVSSVNSSNGSTTPLNFNYDNVNGNLGGCYVQIEGANNYFTIPYGGSSGSDGALQVPIGIPTDVDQGEFCVNFCVFDNNGLISNIVSSCVNVLRLGTGALQISLSWNNETDQDLYVTDPNGEILYYQSASSITGGVLDRDDTDGFGPENIFWLENAPDGIYNVSVNDFEGLGALNTFYITVSGPNQTRNFTGSTQNGNTVDAVRFAKSGDNLSF